MGLRDTRSARGSYADPECDIAGLAAAALVDQGLDTRLAEEAVETARSVNSFGIWIRAQESKRKLVEVPFQVLGATDGEGAPAMPTILRGVIDLAFEEEAGW